LVDLAAALGLNIATGRVQGDVGHASFLKYVNNRLRRSRPDHVLLSKDLFAAVQHVEIVAPELECSNHCSIILTFKSAELCEHVDWDDDSMHECVVGRCNDNSLHFVWDERKQDSYVACLERNERLLGQFHEAVQRSSVENAFSYFQSLVVQAAVDSGMTRKKTCKWQRMKQLRA